MSRIRIYGDTSGYIDIKAPDEAGNTDVVIPEGSFVGQDQFTSSLAEKAPSASPTFTGTVALPLTTNYDGTQLSTTLGSKRDTTDGYVFKETVYFTSSGTFTKATYPWLRAIRVKCQGGGGGGSGGVATNASQYCVGGSGGGGGYAESFITDIAGLDASVTVTVGSGGAGGAAGNNPGSTGGTSSFGSLVSGLGAVGGYVPALYATSTTLVVRLTGPSGGASGTGNLIVHGRQGQSAASGFSSNFVLSEPGGDSFLGSGALMLANNTTRAENGFNWGGGGGGRASSINQSAAAGGAGGPGIVIVELYA
jgi:hypothetical protein